MKSLVSCGYKCRLVCVSSILSFLINSECRTFIYICHRSVITSFVFLNRKITPGLAAPGSPGTYRRKSSTCDQDQLSSLSKMAEVEKDKSPWPNNKDDYELKQIIGKVLLVT